MPYGRKNHHERGHTEMADLEMLKKGITESDREMLSDFEDEE